VTAALAGSAALTSRPDTGHIDVPPALQRTPHAAAGVHSRRRRGVRGWATAGHRITLSCQELAALSAADTGCPDSISAWPLFRRHCHSVRFFGHPRVPGPRGVRRPPVYNHCRRADTGSPSASGHTGHPSGYGGVRRPVRQWSTLQSRPRCPLLPPACPAGRRIQVAGATATEQAGSRSRGARTSRLHVTWRRERHGDFRRSAIGRWQRPATAAGRTWRTPGSGY
jgi:hypothetical protein